MINFVKSSDEYETTSGRAANATGNESNPPVIPVMFTNTPEYLAKTFNKKWGKNKKPKIENESKSVSEQEAAVSSLQKKPVEVKNILPATELEKYIDLCRTRKPSNENHGSVVTFMHENAAKAKLNFPICDYENVSEDQNVNHKAAFMFMCEIKLADVVVGRSTARNKKEAKAACLLALYNILTKKEGDKYKEMCILMLVDGSKELSEKDSLGNPVRFIPAAVVSILPKPSQSGFASKPKKHKRKAPPEPQHVSITEINSLPEGEKKLALLAHCPEAGSAPSSGLISQQRDISGIIPLDKQRASANNVSTTEKTPTGKKPLEAAGIGGLSGQLNPMGPLGRARLNSMRGQYDFVLLMNRLESHPEFSYIGLIQQSASFCKNEFRMENTAVPVVGTAGHTIGVKLFLGPDIIGECVAENKVVAKAAAGKKAFQSLHALFPLIVVKNPDICSEQLITKSDLYAVSVDDDQEIEEANIGHQLLKSMGWSGGGMGKTNQGISTPVRVADVYGRQGLGHGADQGEGAAREHSSGVTPFFLTRIRKVLREFAVGADNPDVDLVFAPGFSMDERVAIHKEAARYNLKTVSRCKGRGRVIVITLRHSSQDLISYLLKHGGHTQKYDLIMPGQYENYKTLCAETRIYQMSQSMVNSASYTGTNTQEQQQQPVQQQQQLQQQMLQQLQQYVQNQNLQGSNEQQQNWQQQNTQQNWQENTQQNWQQNTQQNWQQNRQQNWQQNMQSNWQQQQGWQQNLQQQLQSWQENTQQQLPWQQTNTLSMAGGCTDYGKQTRLDTTNQSLTGSFLNNLPGWN